MIFTRFKGWQYKKPLDKMYRYMDGFRDLSAFATSMHPGAWLEAYLDVLLMH
jgi:hypothetical protein